MFLKETKAKRKSGRIVTYFQLVESFWDKKRKTPRHKVLCNLGRLDKLDKEQIQNLVDKLSSYLDEPKVTEDDLLKFGRTLEFGIPYLVESIWKTLKLYKYLDKFNFIFCFVTMIYNTANLDCQIQAFSDGFANPSGAAKEYENNYVRLLTLAKFSIR